MEDDKKKYYMLKRLVVAFGFMFGVIGYLFAANYREIMIDKDSAMSLWKSGEYELVAQRRIPAGMKEGVGIDLRRRDKFLAMLHQEDTGNSQLVVLKEIGTKPIPALSVFSIPERKSKAISFGFGGGECHASLRLERDSERNPVFSYWTSMSRGEQCLIDLNMDGVLDIRHANLKNKKKSFVLLGDSWKEVDEFDYGSLSARIEDEEYRLLDGEWEPSNEK